MGRLFLVPHVHLEKIFFTRILEIELEENQKCLLKCPSYSKVNKKFTKRSSTIFVPFIVDRLVFRQEILIVETGEMIPTASLGLFLAERFIKIIH